MTYLVPEFEENMLLHLPNTIWWEVRNEFHRAVQIMGMVGRSYCPVHMEDEYATLVWNPDTKSMEGKWIEGQFRLEVDFWEYNLKLRQQDGELLTFPLVGISVSEILEHIKGALTAFGLAAENLKTSYPYKDLPKDVSNQDLPFKELDIEWMKAFSSWYDQAFAILHAIRGTHENCSEIRCWPHHFDLAILMTVNEAESKTIGIGYVPADDHYDIPYFYLGPYPAPKVDLLPEIEGAGKWHKGSWTGGVLLSEELKGLSLPEQSKTFRSFYQKYLTTLIKLLT